VLKHEEYEELCALAAVGEVSKEEQEELKIHLKDCDSCRSVLADLGEIHSKWLPEQPGFEIQRSPAAETRLRRLILNRATAEGARFSDQAFPEAHFELPRARFWRFLRPEYSMAAGILIVLGLAGLAIRMDLDHSTSVLLTVPAPAPVVTLQNTSVNPPPALAKSEAAQTSGSEAQGLLERALKKSQTEREQLEQRLAEAVLRASDMQQTNTQATLVVADLRGQLDSIRKSQAKAEEDLAKVKSSKSEDATELILTREENRQLRDKLNAQTAVVGQERELMAAGREIRDLIAARNLHILDIYDTNGEGKTQKVFGRVFYTEGKSLVFYAYDLPTRHPANKYAYYAWGKRDDQQGRVRNLGVFFNDDHDQKRWVLKITDPQVLSEIDSVFITLEPLDKPGNSPTGKKMLSAFLVSTPNHP
jgi:hypothetical protein